MEMTPFSAAPSPIVHSAKNGCNLLMYCHIAAILLLSAEEILIFFRFYA